MIMSNTQNLSRKLAARALRQALEQGIEHIGNASHAVVAIRPTMIDGSRQIYYTLSFSDKRPDEQELRWPAEDLIMAYLSDDSMPYEANDGITVHCNQAERDGVVLATIGNEMMIEYEMPAGSSALLRYVIRNGEWCGMKNYSYNAVPKRWLDAIRKADMTEWIGMGQRSHIRIPFPGE